MSELLSIESILAELREEERQFEAQLVGVRAAISWFENRNGQPRRRLYENEPAAAGDAPVNGRVQAKSNGKPKGGGKPRVTAVEIAVVEDAPPPEPAARPLLSSEEEELACKRVGTALNRLGRFAYRELLRDGYQYVSSQLLRLLGRMIERGEVAKARFNNANRCICYGRVSWVDRSGKDLSIRLDHMPAGRDVDPDTVEIEMKGGLAQ